MIRCIKDRDLISRWCILMVEAWIVPHMWERTEGRIRWRGLQSAVPRTLLSILSPNISNPWFTKLHILIILRVWCRTIWSLNILSLCLNNIWFISLNILQLWCSRTMWSDQTLSQSSTQCKILSSTKTDKWTITSRNKMKLSGHSWFNRLRSSNKTKVCKTFWLLAPNIVWSNPLKCLCQIWWMPLAWKRHRLLRQWPQCLRLHCSQRNWPTPSLRNRTLLPFSPPSLRSHHSNRKVLLLPAQFNRNNSFRIQFHLKKNWSKNAQKK